MSERRGIFYFSEIISFTKARAPPAVLCLVSGFYHKENRPRSLGLFNPFEKIFDIMLDLELLEEGLLRILLKRAIQIQIIGVHFQMGEETSDLFFGVV